MPVPPPELPFSLSSVSRCSFSLSSAELRARLRFSLSTPAASSLVSDSGFGMPWPALPTELTEVGSEQGSARVVRVIRVIRVSDGARCVARGMTSPRRSSHAYVREREIRA